MKKVFILFLLCLEIAPCLTGCHPAAQEIIKEQQTSDLGYQLIVDEHAKIFLSIDEDAYEVELALSYVDKYLSGEADLDDTLNKVQTSLEALETKLNTLENYTISPQLYEILLQYDMNPEGFELFGNSRHNSLQGYINTLNCIYRLLDGSDEFDSRYQDLLFMHNIEQTILDNERGYYFYGYVNDWFRDWEEEPMAYVQKYILDELKFCSSDKFVWETNHEVILQKVSIYLGTIEDCNTEMIEYIAKISEDLQQIKKDMADLEKLETQYESLDNKEEKLEQLKLINSQMEKMADNMPNSEKAEFQRKLKWMEREVDRQSGQEDIYYQLVIEEYANIIFPIDEDAYLYHCALSDIGEYLSGQISKETALESVQYALEHLEKRQNSWETYTVSLEISDLMREYGILSEIFEVRINNWPNKLQNYIMDLNRIYPHLQQAEEYNRSHLNTALLHELAVQAWELAHMHYFYNYVNYWFADWEDKKISYLQEHVLNKLKCFMPDKYVWETDREVIFKKFDDYTKDMEALTESIPQIQARIEEEYQIKNEEK